MLPSRDKKLRLCQLKQHSVEAALDPVGTEQTTRYTSMKMNFNSGTTFELKRKTICKLA